MVVRAKFEMNTTLKSLTLTGLILCNIYVCQKDKHNIHCALSSFKLINGKSLLWTYKVMFLVTLKMLKVI